MLARRAGRQTVVLLLMAASRSGAVDGTPGARSWATPDRPNLPSFHSQPPPMHQAAVVPAVLSDFRRGVVQQRLFAQYTPRAACLLGHRGRLTPGAKKERRRG
ncbi:hypothetical protein QBC39DRAFT_337088 [Podospora conica]|nr:hypothetical protein QBC39DRAFT_337088 [Schizothecium conicum]